MNALNPDGGPDLKKQLDQIEWRLLQFDLRTSELGRGSNTSIEDAKKDLIAAVSFLSFVNTAYNLVIELNGNGKINLVGQELIFDYLDAAIEVGISQRHLACKTLEALRCDVAELLRLTEAEY